MAHTGVLDPGVSHQLTLDDFDTRKLPPMSDPASGRRWIMRDVDAREALTIAQTLNLDPVLARVIASRGVTAAEASVFLNPSLRDTMPDPYVLADMDVAAKRLASAITDGQRVGVFGDYDVDGVTASAILKSYFDMISAPLDVYLPDRITEGYGPSADAFLQLQANGAELVVTVDCGANAHGPVEEAVDAGLEIIVLDHHMMSGPGPKGAVATVNPNRPDDISGLGNLSAAGVAFMTVVATNRLLRDNGFFTEKPAPDLMSLLDLTALGLVCDVMSLKGLTRTLVAQGLKVMRDGGNPGLQSLGERAGVKGAPSTYHLGFLLGPRINAAGRVGHARLAYELLTTSDPRRRHELAEELHVLNAGRQEIEADVQAAALRDIERHQRHHDQIVVAAGEGWHPGVIGIVAGRIKEEVDKPVVVIGIEHGVGKGSGRSITGVDLGGAISAACEAGILTAGGGHEMAAGLTIPASGVDDLRHYLNERLGPSVEEARRNRTLSVDAVVATRAVTKAFHDLVAQAGPFGPGNPEPVVMIANLRARGLKTVGKGHLSLSVAGPDGSEARAIAFRAAETPIEEILRSGRAFHVTGKIRPDDWRGGNAAQIQVTDAAFAI